jgi:hypothetical protein
VDPGGDERFDVMFDVSDDAERGGDDQQNQGYDGEHSGHSVST